MSKEKPPTVYPYGSKYSSNASYALHVRYIRYSNEDFGLFKTRVQKLINQKILSFSEAWPNVMTNSLPDHSGQVVDAVIGGDCINSVTSMDEYQG